LQVAGIYHLKTQGETTWYDSACAILEEAAQFSPEVSWFADATSRRPFITRRLIPISSAEYPTPAPRPAFSVLSYSRLIRTFGFGLPDWRSQLRLVVEPQCIALLQASRL
jgi:dTDP-4-dehydrorhamnose reductase